MKQLHFILLLPFLFSSHAQSIGELFQEGIEAYDAKKFELYRDRMFHIDSIRPNYPAVVYNLAGGYSLTGNFEQSILTLENYILMDATKDFTQDDDFKAVLSRPEFDRIASLQQVLTKEIKPLESIELEILSSHPESIAYSTSFESFFIGGVRDGKIWQVGNNNVPKLFSNSPKNSWSVMGLALSHDEEILWACTSSMTNFEGFDENEKGSASVLKYNAKSGKLLDSYVLPGNHNFGDLIADKFGNVFISDGVENSFYKIGTNSNRLELFLKLAPTIFNIQGLAFNEDQKVIYFSDYIDGIYSVDLLTKELSKLKVESDEILLKGIDGLYFYKDSLIALHNGTKPNRVVKYSLSKNGARILTHEIRVQGGILGEPTQGVIVDDSFYFISNSPWNAYDQAGNFNPTGNQVFISRIK